MSIYYLAMKISTAKEVIIIKGDQLAARAYYIVTSK